MKLDRFVPIHGSSHRKCFVCGKKWSPKNRLHEVNIDSLRIINRDMKIFVKSSSRCCKKHLDFKKYLNTQDVINMPTKKEKVDRIKINLMGSSRLLDENSYFIERFKDLDSLDDQYCLKITGWKKQEFQNFSKYITSINDSLGRTKDELIALYRYWLRKGIDQFTLSLLFRKKKSQHQISHYLCQIRRAIYYDFVPFYLGTNKPRSFYVKHNTEMVIELYDLKMEDLAIIADATYCRCEKSSNNDLQYKTWSEQKMDLLTKPFIVCCTDGFIIDCYGPFQANQNDATIFDYILKTDRNLISIFKDGRNIIFVDRGFRDIFQKLIDEFHLEPKIPSCLQLKQNDSNSNVSKKKEKQLTLAQTIETRYVTKCRFMVEKQIGALKNFKALDNIRNTILGHIQIDYRIACSMINFTHMPLTNEKSSSLKIAKLIKKRARSEKNHLDFLLTKHLDTKLIRPIEISKIEDFVQLTVNEIVNKIFLGTYQLKLSKSYLNDLTTTNIAYIIDEKLIISIDDLDLRSQFSGTKIIAVEITSRHRRGEKNNSNVKKKNEISKFKNNYRIFLQYIPNEAGTKAIKGYICTCKSGQKMIGCCVHVATLIYYLSYGQKNLIESPAKFLQKLFINFKNMDLPNKPKYLKNTRVNKIKEDLSIKFSTESDLDETEEKNEDKKVDLKSNHQKNEIERKKSSSKLKKKKKIEINDSQQIEMIQNDTSRDNGELENFRQHIPKWGGLIRYRDIENVTLTNTCTIDNYLLALWHLSKIKPECFESDVFNELYLSLKDILKLIDDLDWNLAKEKWINDFLKLTIVPKNNTISLFGTEQNFFLNPLKKIQTHEVIQLCKEECIQNKNLIIREDSEQIFLKKLKKQVVVYSCFTGRCAQCRTKSSTFIRFLKKPNFIFIESADENIYIKDLPEKLKIDNEDYIYLCSTIHTYRHFISIFGLNKRLFKVDDLGQNMVELNVKKPSVFFSKATTVSLYYKAN